MKFGDTLYQRSVPQWAPYNVDYNNLKQLIKESTKDIQTSPVSIPGQGSSDESWRILEEELFPVLCDQHEQTSRFIQSKHGEIGRRLAYLEKRAHQAVQTERTLDSRPIQQTRKYRKLVEDTDSLSNDIQALARFASIQKVAFRKILKKYRKWTGSPTLQTRMDTEVFNRSDSYLRPDLEPFLARLVAVSTDIRDLARGRSQRGRGLGRHQYVSQTPQEDDEEFLDSVDFDAKFSAIRKDNQATYWIHQENLHEARVLLLSHMREWRGQRGAFTTDGSNLVVYDNPTRFAGEGDWLRPELSARWDDGAENAIMVQEHGVSKTDAHQSAISITRVSCKDLSGVLQEMSSNMGLTARANIVSTRSRFQVANGSLMLATMETDIHIASADNDGRVNDQDPAFPHVVLDIRWARNDSVPEAVLAFDQTHLAQKILDFSIGFHAIHSVCNLTTKLPWEDALETDIRKLPPDTRKKRGARHRNSIITSSGQSSGADSVFDSAGQQSSRTSVTDPFSSTNPVSHQTSTEDLSLTLKNKPKRIQFDPANFPKDAPPPQRYWNEFDDGEELGDDEYTIYVIPDKPFHLPGVETFSKASTAIQSGGKRMASWLVPLSLRKSQSNPVGKEGNERAPLLASSGSIDSSSSSESDDVRSPKFKSQTKSKSKPRRRGYHTLITRTWDQHDAEVASPFSSSSPHLNHNLIYSSAVLHVLSLTLLLLATTLKATGRRKAAAEVNAAVILGWVGGLACALGAMACMVYQRRETISWTEVAAGVVLGICELVWDICLGLWVFGSTG